MKRNGSPQVVEFEDCSQSGSDVVTRDKSVKRLGFKDLHKMSQGEEICGMLILGGKTIIKKMQSFLVGFW